jgi:hypothetical protein
MRGRMYIIDQAGDLYYDSGNPEIGIYAVRCSLRPGHVEGMCTACGNMWRACVLHLQGVCKQQWVYIAEVEGNSITMMVKDSMKISSGQHAVPVGPGACAGHSGVAKVGMGGAGLCCSSIRVA